MSIELGKHQIEAIERLSTGKILVGGVGSGKSRTALAYFIMQVCGGTLVVNGEGEYSGLVKPRDLYIFTTAMKRDSLEWDAEGALFSIGRSEETSIDGVVMTVDSWNNIKNYEDVSGAFIIFDEQRVIGTGSWVESFLKLAKKNDWILLSATPGDDWMDYIPVFLANGFYKNRADFAEQHCVYDRFKKYPVVKRWLNERKLERLRASILVDMPVDRVTVRHILEKKVVFDREKFQRVWKDRWNIFKDEPVRDVAELFYLVRKVVNLDGSRIETVRELLKEHPKAIIFYNFDYELEVLRGLSDVTTVAERNGHAHEAVPEGDSWVYLVQYMAGAEAWNCINTNTIIFYSQSYSWRMTEQARGRIDRLNTPFLDLYYYTLVSNNFIDRAIRASLARKKNFNEQIWRKKVTF